MIDLLLNESFVRSLFPWFAASTPALAIVLYALGVGRSVGSFAGAAARAEPEADGSEATSAADFAGTAPSGRPMAEPAGAASESPAAGASAGSRAAVAGVGFLGPLVWIAWILYEAIMDRFGFASVKGLLIVLCLFVAMGLVAGWALGRISRP